MLHNSLSERTISRKFTTLVCCMLLRILISRMAVIGKPSFSVSMRIFFSATCVHASMGGVVEGCKVPANYGHGIPQTPNPHGYNSQRVECYDTATLACYNHS